MQKTHWYVARVAAHVGLQWSLNVVPDQVTFLNFQNLTSFSSWISEAAANSPVRRACGTFARLLRTTALPESLTGESGIAAGAAPQRERVCEVWILPRARKRYEFRVFTYFFYMQISFKLKRNLGGMISTSSVNNFIQRFKYIQTVIIRGNII